MTEEKVFIVYALKSVNRNYIHVGMTDNLERRISQHNKGYNKTTKPYLPFDLILSEKYPSRIEARKRDVYLKSGIGREFLRQLLVKG